MNWLYSKMGSQIETKIQEEIRNTNDIHSIKEQINQHYKKGDEIDKILPLIEKILHSEIKVCKKINGKYEDLTLE